MAVDSLYDTIRKMRAAVEKEKAAKAIQQTVPGAALGLAGGVPGISIATEAPKLSKPIKPEYNITDEVVGTIGRVPYQTISQGLGMAGFVTGSKTLTEAANVAQEESRRAFPSNAPQFSSMADLSSATFTDLAKYALAESGQALASVGSMALPGMAINIALLPLVERAAAASPKIMKLINAIGGVEKAAQYASGWGAGSLLEAGSMQQDFYSDKGEIPERLKILPFAIVAGALEAVPDMILLNRFLEKAPGAKDLVAGKTGRDLVGTIMDYAKSSFGEGATEWAQTLTEESGVKYAGGTPAAEAITSTVTDPNAQARGVAAGIAGLSGGVGMTTLKEGVSFLRGNKSVPADPTPQAATPTINNPVEQVKKILGPEAPVEQVPQQQELSEVVNTLEPESEPLAEAVKKAQETVKQADIGDNASPEDVQLKKAKRKATELFDALGVQDVETITTELLGKPLSQMTLPEVNQTIQAVTQQLAMGNVVGQQEQAAPASAIPGVGIPQPQMTQPTMQPIQRDSFESAVNMARLQARQPVMQQPGMSMARPQMQQTESVTRQITPEDIAPFADKPNIEREATQEELDHLFGDTPEKKADRKIKEEQWRKNFESEENIEAMDPDKVNPDLFDPGFGKNANKGYYKTGKIVSTDKDGKQRYFEVNFTKDLDTGKVTKKIIKGDLTADQKESDLKKEYESLPARTRQVADAIAGLDSSLYLRKEFAKALSVPAGKSHSGNTNYIALETLINSRLRDDASRERLVGKELSDEIKNTKQYDLDKILDKIKERYLKPFDSETSQPTADPFPDKTIPESIEEIKKKLQDIVAYSKTIGGGQNLSQANKDYVKALKDKWEQIKEINAAILTGKTAQKQPAAEPAVTKKAYGESNTIVSKDRYEKLKKRFKDKAKNITSGIDPEMLSIATEMAAYHLEAGARKFADFAKAIIADVGEEFRPYLSASYMGAKYLPGSEKYRAEMDSEQTVSEYKPEPAKTEPQEAISYSRGGADITISADSEGVITITYEYPRQTDLRYLTDRGQLAPIADRAWKVPADRVKQAMALAKEIDVAEAAENSYEHYRNVIRPLQDKVISLAKEKTAEVAEKLLPYAESLLTQKSDNKKLDAAMEEAGLDATDRKKAQEALEGAITLLIRKNNLYGDFDQLLKIYENMPNLNERTGSSMTRQAYSTPHILASLLAEKLNLSDKPLTIYEPTAGNGLLLSGVVENQEGTRNTYFLNELDQKRNEMLQKLFPEAEITNEDATEFAPEINVDLVMANPPFGSMEKKTVNPIQGEKTDIDLKKLEYYISWKALENMRADGKAVLILGAEKEGGITGNHRIFATAIYNQYNVTGHFELDGQFYRKMGAEWPVEIFIIEGRKDYPANRDLIKPPQSVRRIGYAEGWSGVREYLNRPVGTDSGQRSGDNAAVTQRDVEISDGKRSTERPGDRPSESAKPVSAESSAEQEKQSVADSNRDNEQRRDTERIERVKRELADEGTERPGQRGDTTTPDTVKSGSDDTRIASDGVRVESLAIESDEIGASDSIQESYNPVSKNNSIGALISKALAIPTREALDSLLEKTGEKSLDDYVAKQLGYKSGKDIPFFSAEQVDALVESFYSLLKGSGNIIADQTGVGKGRVAAAIIQWAVKQGKIPVFFTEKVGLFNDIYRDMRAIGGDKLRPFMFNSDGEMSYENDAGEKVVAYKHNKKVFSEVFKRMIAGDYSDFTGPNKKFDYIALTYSQIRDGEDQRAKKKTLKKDAFAMARNLISILDESHNAAGAAGDVSREGGRSRDKKQSNQMANTMEVINRDRSSGVTYLSATWAKTPENMPVYHRVFDQANLTQDEIQTAFDRGDIAMQEMVVASLATNGKYIRREQSFAGVSWRKNETEPKSAQADKERSQADRAMNATRKLINLDRTVSATLSDLNLVEIIDTFKIDVPEEFIGGDAALGGNISSSLDNPDSPFSSVHNYVNTFLAAVKADRAADRAIEMIMAGKKPIITVQNTMESHMDSLIEIGAAEIDKPFPGTYAEILETKINSLLYVTIKHPTKENTTFKFKLPEEALPVETQQLIEAFRAELKKMNLKDLPFSPIDYVMAKIKAAGFNVGEITGRGKYLDYSELVDGQPTMKSRAGSETTNAGKRRILTRFNNGELDALILNSSGATGLSAHSSRDFKDQRQRAMLILQPFDDINTFVQMLGRIHRTGGIYSADKVTSVIPGKPASYGFPEYEYIQSSLGMEVRPAARLDAKAKSLNANTSSNKKGHQDISDIDVANKYGSRTIQRWLSRNKNYAYDLGYENDSDIRNAKASQVTGRVAILDQQVQQTFWDEVIKEYDDLISELDSLDANDLKVATYDKADAVTADKKVVYGEEGNPDTPPVYLEKIDMAIPGNPTSYDAALNRSKKGSNPTADQIAANDAAFEKFIAFKEAEKKEYEERTKKQSGINIQSLKSGVESVKKLLNKFKVGSYVNGVIDVESDGGGVASEVDAIGIVTDVKMLPVQEGFIGNPWIPSRIRVTIATPSFASGQIVVPLSRIATWLSTDTQNIYPAIEQDYRRKWQKAFNANSNRRVTRMALSGDMIKASSMAADSTAAQLQRRDGQQELVWLSRESEMTITQPVEKLSEKQMDNPPAIMSSMDSDRAVMIADWRPESVPYWQKQPAKKHWRPVETGAESYDIRIRYNSPIRKAIMQDKKLAELLDPAEKDPFVKETLTKNANFMVLKDTVSKADLPPILKRLAEILEENGSGLTDAGTATRRIDTDFASDRAGSSQLLGIINQYIADKIYDALESAYNFLVRGGGSFVEWIKTTGNKFIGVTAKAWKDARKLFTAANKMLGRRGGIMTLTEFKKALKESLATASEETKKPLPTSAVDEMIDVATDTAYEIGQVAGRTAANKRAATLRAKALMKTRKKIAEIRGVQKLNYDSRKYLVEIASKLPRELKGDLLRAIATANTPKQVGDVFDRIDKAYDKWTRRLALTRFRDAIKAARKLRPEFQKLADAIKNKPDDVASAHAAIVDIVDYLEDNPSVLVPAEVVAAMKAMQSIKPKEMPIDQIMNIAMALEMIKFASDQANKKIFAGNSKTLMESVSDISEYVDSEKSLADEKGEMSGAKWFSEIGSMQYEPITEMMGETGRKLFYDDMREGERKTKEIWFEGRDALHDAMNKSGQNPDSVETAEWTEEKQTFDTGFGMVEMTRDEKLNLVANLLDPDTFKEIVGYETKKKGFRKGAGFKLQPASAKTQAITTMAAKVLINSLSKSEKAVVESMRGFLNGNLKGYANESLVQLSGYEKATRKDYWPREREGAKTGLNEGYKNWAKTTLEELGIFKERSTSKSPVVIRGIMETYQNHLKKTSALAGFGVPVRNLELALGSGGLSKKLEAKYGKKYVQRLEAQIQAAVDLGTTSGGVIDSWVGNVLQNVSVGFLGYNPRSAIKQFGGLFTAATEIDGSLLAESMGSAFDKKVESEMFENSAILRDRYDSTGAKLVTPEFGEKRGAIVGLTKKEIRQRNAMKWLENMDKAVSQIIWTAAKKEIQAKQPDLKGKALMRAIAARAESIVSRTQNATSVLDMSGIAIEGRKNQLMKAATMFQSQGNSIYNIMRRSIRDFRKGKISASAMLWRMTKAGLGNALWSSMIGSIVSAAALKSLAGGGGDDEEERRKLITMSETLTDVVQENLNMFYGMSLLSSSVRSVARMVNKEPAFSSSGRVETPLESTMSNTLSGGLEIIGAVLKGDEVYKTGKNKNKLKSDIEFKRGAKKLVRGILPVIGEPLYPVSELIKLLYSK